jgi:hypothetical protein
MESIAPPLRLVLSLRRSIENGESMAGALRNYLKLSSDDLTAVVTQRLLQQTFSGSSQVPSQPVLSPCREALVAVIQAGLAGQPVLTSIIRLEEEIVQQCRLEMDRTLSLIPFQLMWPILFLQFPAYLILVLGPLLDQLAKGLA